MPVKEVLSPAEERFERGRRRAGLVVAPLVFLVLYFMPIPALTEESHRLLAVIGFVLVFWLSEAVPLAVTALLGAVLNVLLGVAPAATVLAPFAHPLVFLFIGSFILAEAITLHGLDKRFAFAIISIKFLQASPVRILFALGVISAVASMWVSNTASTAMMLPIGIGILHAMRDIDEGGSEKEGAGKVVTKRFSSALMLMIAYGASVGGIATPIGTPPNLIGIGMIDSLMGIKITFFEWMTFALPITIVMFAYLFIVLGGISMRGAAGVRSIRHRVVRRQRQARARPLVEGREEYRRCLCPYGISLDTPKHRLSCNRKRGGVIDLNKVKAQCRGGRGLCRRAPFYFAA